MIQSGSVPYLSRKTVQQTGVATMDSAEVIEKLKTYKKLLSKHMIFDEMILFGSYAKGNARADSDVDVAIIVTTLSGDYFSTRPLLWKIRREVDDRIEPVLIEKNHDESGFLSEIVKTGVII